MMKTDWGVGKLLHNFLISRNLYGLPPSVILEILIPVAEKGRTSYVITLFILL